VTRRRQILLDCLLLFLCTWILIRPYVLNKYTNQWPSIESTFIADARFLAAHLPHPQWQPLWYTGTRFDYIYPPALRYGTALISKVTGYWPVKAYHFYTLFFYCAGIAGVYFLMRAGGRKRGFAFLGGALSALTSPCFLFMKDMRADSAFLTPIRLGVLLRYGEGPHMTALALIPFALALTWLALERGRAIWVAAAGVMCAAVVSNNFYGATALAILYPLLVWSFWLCQGKDQGRRLILTAAAIPVLAYALTAFWLTPSYLTITSHNMRYVAQPGTLWSYWLAAVVITAYVTFTRRFARWRPERTWAVFVIGIVSFFALNVLGNYYLDFNVTGDPHRLIPELDLVLILGFLLVLEWLWKRRSRAWRVAVILLAAAPLVFAQRYVRMAWHIVDRYPDYTKTLEFRVTDWLWQNMPDARIESAGTVRFWFDAWHDLYEMGGGSDQGILNPVVQDAQWEINQGADLALSKLWMQALGVDAMYVAGPKSRQVYKDYKDPGKFGGLPVLFDDGEDNRIYRIDRRYRVRARVVDAARFRGRKTPYIEDMAALLSYVDTVEKGPDIAPRIERRDTDSMTVRAKVGPGQALLVQESFDPAWHAWSGGKAAVIHPDPMGFMLVEAPVGDVEVQMAFVTPLENRIGRAITVYVVFLLVWLVWRERRSRRAA
jgi:hypothetical protein